MSKQELMFSLVQQQEQSNLTISDFCIEHNVKRGAFQYWRKKYLQSNSPAGFIPIVAPSPECTSIRLSYPNGLNIHLSAADLPLITHLIRLA